MIFVNTFCIPALPYFLSLTASTYKMPLLVHEMKYRITAIGFINFMCNFTGSKQKSHPQNIVSCSLSQTNNYD